MQCRSCSSSELDSIIPLGKLPLANALLKDIHVEEQTWNLEVMLCQACGLAQLKDIIEPSELFSDYVYFSSNSDTMLSFAKSLVDSLLPSLKQDSFVVEIASNDGYLLKNYVQAGIKVLGVDPAKNIAKVANQSGVPTMCDFFSQPVSETIVDDYGQADIIHANNVFAHVPDINDFIAGLKTLLKPTGHCIIEVPYFLDLVQKLEFDTIYHEHVYYFAVKPLKQAFARHGLALFDIEKIPLHGGTLRLSVGHAQQHPVSEQIDQYINQENEANLYEKDTYRHFMDKLATLKQTLHDELTQLKNKGHKIAAYGASAKGTTLLNFTGIGQNLIDFVVDRSPAKQGFFTPGTKLKIHKPDALIDKNVDYALLLAWNFADEILKQQKEYRQKQGKFVIPLPEVEVVA